MAVRQGLSQLVTRKNESIRLLEEQMQLKRLFMGFVLGIIASLLASTSFAQSSPCSQPMLIGKWLFSPPGLGTEGFACPISIGATGTISSSGSCTLSPGWSTVQPPSGILSISSTCHVTGSISYSYCSTSPHTTCSASTINVTEAVKLWRSLDGSRLTGYSILSYAGQAFSVGPFEIIYKP